MRMKFRIELPDLLNANFSSDDKQIPKLCDVGNGLQMFVRGQVKGLYLVYNKILYHVLSTVAGFRRAHFR